jgi:hypothetical protein
VPSPSSLASNILLNIFLSVINNFLFIDSYSTHVSQACVITCKLGIVNGKTYEFNIRVTCWFNEIYKTQNRHMNITHPRERGKVKFNITFHSSLSRFLKK